jgi:hypothetical protein
MFLLGFGCGKREGFGLDALPGFGFGKRDGFGLDALLDKADALLGEQAGWQLRAVAAVCQPLFALQYRFAI